MAMKGPEAAELDRRVRIERRAAANDGAGNHRGGWVSLIAGRWAKITATRGGSEVVADRLAGVSAFDVWVRNDPDTKGIKASDRLVDITITGEERFYQIAFAEIMTDDRRWVLIQAEATEGLDRSGQ